MALDASRLGSAIWTAIKSLHDYDGTLTSELDLAGELLWQTIATEIVSEITTNAVVEASGADPQGGTQDVTGTVT